MSHRTASAAALWRTANPVYHVAAQSGLFSLVFQFCDCERGRHPFIFDSNRPPPCLIPERLIIPQNHADNTRDFMPSEFAVLPAELAIEVAVRDGKIDLLQLWMIKSCVPRKEEMAPTILSLAINYSRLDVLQWLLLEHRQQVDSLQYCGEYQDQGPVSKRASMSDQDDAMQIALDNAAACGHLKVLQWIHANRRERCSKIALCCALTNGHIELADWLYENYPADHFDYPQDGCRSLAMANWYVHKFQWKNAASRDAWINGCIDSAAHHGQLDVIDFLYAVQPDADPHHGIERASAAGHFNVVMFLHDCGARTTKNAMDNAAANGHLEIVQWLHLNRQEGCTTKAMDRAAAANHLHVVQWLHEHRGEGCTSDAMDDAAGNGHLEMVKWLHANTICSSCTAKGIEKARVSGNVEVLKWLHANTTSVGTIALLHARCSSFGKSWRELVFNMQDGE